MNAALIIRRCLAAVACAVFLVAVLAGSATQASARIDWSEGWYEGFEGFHEAYEKAIETDQPVLVYFYTDWCGYCRQLERELLPTPEVQTALEDVIKVRINPESGPQEGGISRRYGVSSFPSLFMHPPGLQAPRKIVRGVRDQNGLRLQTPVEFGNTLRAAAE